MRSAAKTSQGVAVRAGKGQRAKSKEQRLEQQKVDANVSTGTALPEPVQQGKHGADRESDPNARSTLRRHWYHRGKRGIGRLVWVYAWIHAVQRQRQFSRITPAISASATFDFGIPFDVVADCGSSRFYPLRCTIESRSARKNQPTKPPRIAN